MSKSNKLIEKWSGLLEADGVAPIKDARKKAVVAQLLENTEANFAGGSFEKISEFDLQDLNEAAPTNSTGSAVANYDPVLISLIRRAAPNLIAFDIAGVQPMTGPTGQIFALRSRYSNQTGAEAFFNEANTGFSSVRGGNTQILGDATLNLGTTPTGNAQTYNYATGMTTAQAEALGSTGNVAWAEMGLSIEKVIVNTVSRNLKAEYSVELAQDIKAIHGLDLEKELANIIATELTAEINREVVRAVYATAVPGSQVGVTTAGSYDLDTDSNGRWMGEKFAGLHFQLALESNAIAKATRRGKGNILITSSNVASALEMAGVLKFNEAAMNLNIDDTGVTFAGMIGKLKVFIDPYATGDYFVLGYKGVNTWDAGLFYCPYTPLQMVRALGQDTFQPKIGMRTRYGMVANPFSGGAAVSNGTLITNSNVYYRRTTVTNIQ